MLGFCIISAFTVTSIAFIIATKKPEVKVLLTSVLFQDPSNISLWIRMMFGLILIWLLTVLWGCALGYITIVFLPVLASSFLISELKCVVKKLLQFK